MILTNGIETFAMIETVDDARGVTIRAMDLQGNWYELCNAACDHSQVPAGAIAWHDAENTETLWEDRLVSITNKCEECCETFLEGNGFCGDDMVLCRTCSLKYAEEHPDEVRATGRSF